MCVFCSYTNSREFVYFFCFYIIAYIYKNICMEMSDNCRPALIVSADGNNASEDLSALLMPVMV